LESEFKVSLIEGVRNMRKFLELLFALSLVFLYCGAAFAAESGPNFGAVELKGESVYYKGEKLDCEVYEVPEGAELPFDRYVVIGPGILDSIAESDTGIWCFGEENDQFIPLDSDAEFQDIVWGKGGRFVLVRGSGIRADMFFDVYALSGEGAENTEPFLKKKAEFSGVRGEIAWTSDGMRCAFTRIDDTREEAGELANAPYWLRLSAVLYDPAVDETTVLKESTDKQNFRFVSISGDDEKIVLSEEYVKTPKDWADEDKVKTREITVPVPAAG
jgi:hypothetical protein